MTSVIFDKNMIDMFMLIRAIFQVWLVLVLHLIG